jgi:hypothetical protein
MKHKYLIITLNKKYSTDEDYILANALMEFEKIVGVEAAYDYQIKRKKRKP